MNTNIHCIAKFEFILIDNHLRLVRLVRQVGLVGLVRLVGLVGLVGLVRKDEDSYSIMLYPGVIVTDCGPASPCYGIIRKNTSFI